MIRQHFFIFPHQMYEDIFLSQKNVVFYLIEDEYFFGQRKVHPFQRILCRAGLQALRERLLVAGYTVHYLAAAPADPAHTPLKSACALAAKNGAHTIMCYAPFIPELTEKITRECDLHGLAAVVQASPGSLLHPEDIKKIESIGALTPKAITDYFLKKYEISLPKKSISNPDLSEVGIPPIPLPDHSRYAEEAIEYESLHFSHFKTHIDLHSFFYPVTHDDANDWLDAFIVERLQWFDCGVGEIHPEHPFLFHSVLSPLLAVGLVTPNQVVTRVAEMIQVLNAPGAIQLFLHKLIGVREYGLWCLQQAAPKPARHQSGEQIPTGILTQRTDRRAQMVVERLVRHGYIHSGEIVYLKNFLKASGVKKQVIAQFLAAHHLGFLHSDLT